MSVISIFDKFSVFDKDAKISLNGLIDTIQTMNKPTSLTEAAKESMVNSRVYIEKNLATDDILTPLMQNVMSLYCGLIFTAINLNQNIVGSKKVSDYSSIVASAEAFDDPTKNSFDSTMSLMKDYFVGSNKSKMLNQTFAGLEAANNATPRHPVTINNTFKNDWKPSTVIDPDPKNVSLPTGRILNIPMMTDAKVGFNLQLLVQLFPFFVNSDVAQAFIDLNFSPSFSRRYRAAEAGEISFFKDFILSCDLRQKRMKALLNDKSGGLADMINKQKNAVASHWMNLFKNSDTAKINIANTILIFNKSTIDKTLNNLGLNFNNYRDRKNFFEKSYCMMLILVDQMYNEVTIYYNGIEAVSTFKYEQIKRESKKDSTDLVSIMKAYAQGLAPKF